MSCLKKETKKNPKIKQINGYEMKSGALIGSTMHMGQTCKKG